MSLLSYCLLINGRCRQSKIKPLRFYVCLYSFLGHASFLVLWRTHYDSGPLQFCGELLCFIIVQHFSLIYRQRQYWIFIFFVFSAEMKRIVKQNIGQGPEYWRTQAVNWKRLIPVQLLRDYHFLGYSCHSNRLQLFTEANSPIITTQRQKCIIQNVYSNKCNIFIGFI